MINLKSFHLFENNSDNIIETTEDVIIDYIDTNKCHIIQSNKYFKCYRFEDNYDFNKANQRLNDFKKISTYHFIN